MSSAYLLVSHGSRDPRSQAAAHYLSQLVLQQLDSPKLRRLLSSPRLVPHRPPPIAGTTTLEFAPLPLERSIEQFARRAKASGFTEVAIVPLFLHAGVHVLEDLPVAVARAQQTLASTIPLKLLPHLGSYAGILPPIERQFEQLDAPRRILVAHGSRRAGGNDAIAALAARFNAQIAYWSVAPSLGDRVAALAAGEPIAILPYFLFAGGITEALAVEIEQLQRQFPDTPLRFGHPLGATPELAASIVEALAVDRV